jgi:hypothetical protein
MSYRQRLFQAISIAHAADLTGLSIPEILATGRAQGVECAGLSSYHPAKASEALDVAEKLATSKIQSK